jgi:hypothetical protein
MSLLAALVLDQFLQLTVSLPAGRIEEPCFPMSTGDLVSYRFSADRPLDFNLHYHEGGVFYPRRADGIREGEGEFEAPAARTYCLMWANGGSTAATLEYEFRILRAEQREEQAQ